MPSLNFLAKSAIALGAIVGGGVGVAYGVTNSSTKNDVKQLSAQQPIEREKGENSLVPLNLKANEENFVHQEKSPEKNTLSEKGDNLSQLIVSPSEKEDSGKKLKNKEEEGKNNPIQKQNPTSVAEKERDIEAPFSFVNELSKDNSLSKNYFLKGEKDSLEEEEWRAEDCKWVGSDSAIKLKCQWANGEIYSNSREVIFNFSEKDIINHQLNNADIRNKITEIYFEPLASGGELSLVFDSYETINIRLEHKKSSDN